MSRQWEDKENKRVRETTHVEENYKWSKEWEQKQEKQKDREDKERRGAGAIRTSAAAAPVWRSLSLAATCRLHRTSAGLTQIPRHGDKLLQVLCSLRKTQTCEIHKLHNIFVWVSRLTAKLWGKKAIAWNDEHSVFLWLLWETVKIVTNVSYFLF